MSPSAVDLIVLVHVPCLNAELSVENTRGLGSKLYRFDVSLMERLADNGLKVNSLIFGGSKMDEIVDLPLCLRL